MTTTPRATAVLRSPAELITLLPYQLGYRPRSSLVMVMLRQLPEGSTTIGPVMRVDLPRPEEESAVLAEVSRQLLQVVHSHGVSAVLLVAFEDDRDEDATTALALLAAACAQSGAAQPAVVARVRDDRWCRLDAEGEACLDSLLPQWQPLPSPPDVPAVADFVLQGHSPLPDREALCRRLDTTGPSATHAAVRQMLDGAGGGNGRGAPVRDEEEIPGRDCADRWSAVWAHVLRRGPDELAAVELALLVRSLRSLPFRDALLWSLAPGPGATDGDGHGPGQPEIVAVLRAMLPAERPSRGALLERLHALAVRVPREQRAPVLTLLGVVAWWHGDGTLANIAVERALEQEPTYALAALMDLALQQAVPPPGYPVVHG